MSSQLQGRVESVRCGAQRLVRQYGLARFAAAALTLVLGGGALDYLFRIHNPAARWLLSLALFAGISYLFVRLAGPALAVRTNLVSAARRIELRYPALGEQLSSAMAFLTQSAGDPTAGSPGLRRAVVAEAEALAAGLDF